LARIVLAGKRRSRRASGALVPGGEGADGPGALQPNAGLGPSGYFDSCLPCSRCHVMCDPFPGGVSAGDPFGPAVRGLVHRFLAAVWRTVDRPQSGGSAAGVVLPSRRSGGRLPGSARFPCHGCRGPFGAGRHRASRPAEPWRSGGLASGHDPLRFVAAMVLDHGGLESCGSRSSWPPSHAVDGRDGSGRSRAAVEAKWRGYGRVPCAPARIDSERLQRDHFRPRSAPSLGVTQFRTFCAQPARKTSH
jgi:hypothetical protein